MNEPETEILWTYLRELWPTFDLPGDDDRRRVKHMAWADVVGDLDANLLRRAAAMLSDREFAPTPGQLRLKAIRLLAASHGLPVPPEFDRAWAEIQEALHRIGSYGRPTWSHSALAQTVDSIGWQTICLTDTANLSTLRAQVRDMYATAVGRWERQTYPMPALNGSRPALVAVSLAVPGEIGAGR